MTILGWIIVVVASLIVGVVAQYVLKAESMPYRWALTAVATFIGAAVASEMLFNGTTPELEGMALWPAIIGGLVVGIVVDLVAVYFSRQSAGGGTAVR
ncbi:MAG TPA: hypothetical protein VK194_07220 [Candidatus Deferrimicrobium sp.]|nr:hypothetical protein [Candidatus Deferrimicrobium sp.]